MKYRFLIGIIILLAVAGLIAAYLIWGTAPPVTVVSGHSGGSKANLLNDPDVKTILREKYQLEVTFNTFGGLEQVCNIKPPYDFLWPGTDLSVAEYKSCGGSLVASDSLLLSPVIFYSWEPVTEALNAKGLIEKKPDGIYYVDMERFGPLLLDGKTTWQNVGVNAFGNFAVSISDPTTSNSGQVFAAMLGKLRQKQNSSDSFEETFAEIQNYSANIGNKPHSTSELFKLCLGKGAGACPLFAAYESLLADFVVTNNLQCPQLKSLQAIYPNPTVWATHPLIAATPNGKKLLGALQDPDIQRIAVEKHGFRSILGDTQPHSCFQTAVSVNAMPLPTKEEMDRLQKFLTTP